MGLGAVCHTLNPRLSDSDLVYISNHAQDTVLLADAPFLPLLQRVVPACPLLRAVVRCLPVRGEGGEGGTGMSVPLLSRQCIAD